jgi:hypothetical protein
MTNEEKAKLYQNLMYENDLLSNQINSIKGESFELNNSQIQQIKMLEAKQQNLMATLNRLLTQ